jgi:hypothetical protein
VTGVLLAESCRGRLTGSLGCQFRHELARHRTGLEHGVRHAYSRLTLDGERDLDHAEEASRETPLVRRTLCLSVAGRSPVRVLAEGAISPSGTAGRVPATPTSRPTSSPGPLEAACRFL